MCLHQVLVSGEMGIKAIVHNMIHVFASSSSKQRVGL